jgi:hypothetical protein
MPWRRRISGRMASVICTGDYQAAPGTAAADWVPAGLRGPGESVLSVVPGGFEAYARIFHPASQDDQSGPVRWRDVAAANGRVAHPAMQWPSITGLHPFGEQDGQPGLWDGEPAEGSLPAGTAAVLAAVLAGHTAAAGQCWFAVWDGYGTLALRGPPPPAFTVPGRRLLLLTGPVSSVTASLCAPPFQQSPNLWWPGDRAWCVGTDIDFMSSYVGGTRQCVADILRQPALEALAACPSDGVTWSSDPRNPVPGRPSR